MVWDNLNARRTTGMKQYAADHDWLTVFQCVRPRTASCSVWFASFELVVIGDAVGDPVVVPTGERLAGPP
ncbi:hypothetical protein ABZ721_31605 [Streptomyces sp. NPDC006733]|uniref:hypothetical protein n=1 Tax=Streptomyces sp. NPDC006733 TaxID=3155460 RepID=UPI0033D5CF82